MLFLAVEIVHVLPLYINDTSMYRKHFLSLLRNAFAVKHGYNEVPQTGDFALL